MSPPLLFSHTPRPIVPITKAKRASKNPRFMSRHVAMRMEEGEEADGNSGRGRWRQPHPHPQTRRVWSRQISHGGGDVLEEREGGRGEKSISTPGHKTGEKKKERDEICIALPSQESREKATLLPLLLHEDKKKLKQANLSMLNFPKFNLLRRQKNATQTH